MVRIEAGTARLGNSPAKLKAHFQSLPELAANAELLAQVMQAATQETEKQVQVPAFWIDRYEVTNAEYAEFLKATRHEPPEGWSSPNPPPGSEDRPVHQIRHRDAEAYASWAGKKLPTRQQWMRAFRGDHDWLFPWGDDFEASRANVAENKTFPSTSPVRGTPQDRSPFDVYNMEGNVCEYLREKIAVGEQSAVVVKGAHYGAMGRLYGIGCMQVILNPALTSPGFGFRCVVEEPLQALPR
jgi:formylglycine-generating enzyme required for sulfatase activity